MWAKLKLFLFSVVVLSLADSILLGVRSLPKEKHKKRPLYPNIIRWIFLSLILVFGNLPWVLGAAVYGAISCMTEPPDSPEKLQDFFLDMGSGAIVFTVASYASLVYTPTEAPIGNLMGIISHPLGL
jgi:hypothetical protein